MAKTKDKVGVIIVGAGNSKRMGTDKIFSLVSCKELLSWSLDIFQNSDFIDQIVIVLNKRNIDLGNKLISTRHYSKVSSICIGGQLRQDSVRIGLQELCNCDWVIIHDAARPFITNDIIKRGLEAVQETGSAVAAIPVNDTIKSVDHNSLVDATLDRSKLWSIQTPQIFRSDIIMNAYQQISSTVTDDACLVELAGYKVKIFLGSHHNIKITTPEDIIFAKAIAKGI